MKEFDLDFERHTTYRVEAENEQEAIAKFRKMEEEEQEYFGDNDFFLYDPESLRR